MQPSQLPQSTFFYMSCHVLFETTSSSAWVVTAATLVGLLPSVGVGMVLQTTSWSAWVVTAATLVMLLPCVGVGMSLQFISSTTWVVTTATLIKFLFSVDHVMAPQLALLGSREVTQVTFPHTRSPQHITTKLPSQVFAPSLLWKTIFEIAPWSLSFLIAPSDCL